MSDSTSQHWSDRLQSFPDDLLYEVFSYLPASSLLCLRQVSRRLQDVTHVRTVWVNAYRNAPFVRPPGPFPSQSIADIQKILTNSLNLHMNWTSLAPRQTVSQRTPVSRPLTSPGSPELNMKLVLGRYLFFQDADELSCYDLDSHDRGPAKPIASYMSRSSFSVFHPFLDCKAVDGDGDTPQDEIEISCALLKREKIGNSMQITMLTLYVSRDTAKFDVTGDVEVPRRVSYRHLSITGDFLVLEASGDPIVVHIPTRQLYALPPCDFRDVAASPASYTRCESILTSTHLLAITHGIQNVVEAFPLPQIASTQLDDDGPSAALVLARSHIDFIPLGIRHLMFLSCAKTRRASDRDDGSTPATTFLALSSSWKNEKWENEIGFFKVTLNSRSPSSGDGSISTSWRPVVGCGGPGDYVWYFHGNPQDGLANLVGLSGLSNDLLALVVVDEGNSGSSGVEDNKSIVCRRLPIEKAKTECMKCFAWDGIRGRLCISRLTRDEANIEVFEYI